MNDYYLQQINDKVEQIKSNTDLEAQITPIISTNLFNIKENTQEIISGDRLIIENQQQTINLLGGELLILVALLLYLFIVRSLK